MSIIEVEGLGRVEIEGDTPNEAENQAIINALQKRQARQPSVSTPLTAEEDEDASFLNEVVPQLAGGIRDAAQSALNLIVNRPAKAAGISFINEEGNYDFDYTPMAERTSGNTDRAFKPLELPTVNPAKTAGGNVIRTMSQFFVPYLGAMKVIGVGRGVLGSLAKAEGAAILTEQVVFDPFDEKLADLIQDFPALSNPITEYLQTDDDDTERDARFKLALESAGLGAMFVTISSAIKGLTQLKKGNTNPALDEISKSEKANLDNVSGERSIVEIKAEQQGVPVEKVIGSPVSKGDPKSQPSPLPLEKYVGRDIQSTKDLQDILRSVETKKKAELDYYNDNVHSEEHVRALSQESGLTPEEILSKDFNALWNDGAQYRMRELMAESAIGLHDLAVIARNSGSETDLLRLKDALDMHVALQGQVMAMRAETGRALRQWRYVVGANIDEMLTAAGGKKNMNDIAKMLSSTDPTNVANVNKLANKLNDPTLSDKWLEAWINGLLSGPQTHVVNILSNILTGLWSIPEQYLAAGIGALKRTPDRITFGEVNARAWGYLQGAREGISLAKKTFLTETPSDIFSKLEARREKAIKGPLGKFVRLPGRALMASDEFFKAIGYRMELNAQGYRSAIRAGLKPNDRKFAEHMKGVMDDLPIGKNKAETEKLIKAKAKTLKMSVSELEELKREVNLKATNNARYLTFTKPLEGISRHITKITSEMPITKLIAPFIRTPVNIVRFAAERTPFGVFMREHKGLKGAAKDTQQAKLAFGAMVGASTAAMAAQGKITGSGPSDPKAMAALRLTKWQPYSFVIDQEDGTKRYLAYNRVEPLGIILGLSADFSDIYGSLNDEDADSIGARISASISKNLTDKTFFRGITDVIEAANDPDRFFDAYARNMAGTIVPTGLAQAARTIDPVVRDAQTYMDKIKSRIPGYSQTLEARPNLWGEPIIMSGGLGPDILSPIYSSFSNNDPVSNELVRLKYSPSMPQRSIDGVKIPPKLYNRFARRAGKAAHFILEQYLVSTPQYRKLDKYPSAQITKIKNIIEKTRAAASTILRAEMGMVFRKRDRDLLRDIRRSNPKMFESLDIPERIKKNI
jgi:hypothetical protein